MITARILVLVAAAGAFAACASGGGGGGAASEGAPAGIAMSYPGAPAGTALVKVDVGMNDTEVRKILGDPEDSKGYMTAKAWMPLYWGSDTHRTDWMYRGQGRIVFSRNRYSGGLEVIRVLHNPNELE